MARLKTFASDGTGIIYPTDLNNIEDDYECAFGTYGEILYVGGTTLDESGLTTTPALLSLFVYNDGNHSDALFYLDPALYWGDAATSSTNARTVYYNLAIWIVTNAAAPGGTQTFGLFPITGTSVGWPQYNVIPSATAVTGSTVTFTSLVSGTSYTKYSGDFAAPAAGYYGVGFTTTAPAAGSSTTILGQLLVRRV